MVNIIIQKPELLVLEHSIGELFLFIFGELFPDLFLGVKIAGN